MDAAQKHSVSDDTEKLMRCWEKATDKHTKHLRLMQKPRIAFKVKINSLIK